MSKGKVIFVTVLAVAGLGINAQPSIRQRKGDSSPGGLDNREVKRAVFGIKFGSMASGDAHMHGWDESLKSGHSLGVFVDLRTRSWASFGLSLESGGQYGQSFHRKSGLLA